MKVNFNKAFKDAFGNEIKENGKTTMMRESIAQVLFGGHYLEKTGKVDDASKLASYRLSLKIAESSGVIDITAEEAVMIKQAASMLVAGAYGQICDLVEG